MTDDTPITQGEQAEQALDGEQLADLAVPPADEETVLGGAGLKLLYDDESPKET